MKRKLILIFISVFILETTAFAIDRSIFSPDGSIELKVSDTNGLTYSISLNGRTLVAESPIALQLRQDDGWQSLKIKKAKATQGKSEEIVAPLYRQSTYNTGDYSELTLTLNAEYGVVFRVYDEGVAYRFILNSKDEEVIIYDELARFNFAEDYVIYLSHSANPRNQTTMSFQNIYTVKPVSESDSSVIAFMPAAADCRDGVKIVITESDLEAYPGMFLRADRQGLALEGEFAHYPKSFRRSKTRQQAHVAATEDYIAKVAGKRALPWRVLAISEKDTELPVNNLVYTLASPNRIGDCSWIKSGKVAWEWWNDWGIYGVDFEVGINTETYMHYIDFAAENGLEFVVLDEGWYVPGSGDMLTVIPEIDLEKLVAYGKSKNVDLILWTVFNVLDDQLEEACRKYSEMGIVGFKVDFLDRDDQNGVEMAYRIAEKCAEYHLVLDFHGFYKPTGMNRTFPHIINLEGLFGLEEVKWTQVRDMPVNDVTIPFLRILAGPADYTQGAMDNASKKNFRVVYNDPMSQGTRCHQLAMYIVYDSPLVMLADSPTAYRKEKECTEFIASIPVVFDKTVIPAGELGRYIVTARKGGDNWYIGGMTDWDSREISLNLSFLDEGEYNAVIFKDGKQADKYAEDYTVETAVLKNTDTVKIHMAEGGGFAIRLQKVK